ncbi:MmgE/PrpD family protein, partial [Chloroflexota bacterium]
MSVAEELAKYTREFNFYNLPPDVVHHAKRAMLDTLACAIGGYASDASQIVQKQIREMGGIEEATVIGSGLRTSCPGAALCNGVMVRYLDYNDTAFIQTEEAYRTGYHPSEVIPPILALSERQHLSGKEIITAIVLGYELSLRFLECPVGREMPQRGWNGDTRGAYIVPLIAGRMLQLDDKQIANAVGISGSNHAVLNILDVDGEEYTMTKNLRFPMMAYGGILATLMAQKGFTGPDRVIEGHHGFVEAVMNGEFEIDKLIDPQIRYVIRDTCLKSIIADYSSHGHLRATLQLVRENDI